MVPVSPDTMGHMDISTPHELANQPHGQVIVDANGLWARKGFPTYPERGTWYTFGSTEAVDVVLPARVVQS